MNKNTVFVTLTLMLSAIVPLRSAAAGPPVEDEIELESTSLPIVIIDTGGADIPDVRRIAARMSIIYNGPGAVNRITDLPAHYDGRISIELRGSSSLQFPKKQYALETQDSLGNNLNISLLGLPEENDWILYDPYSDKSLLRNVLVYRIARKMGRYASRTRFCELVLNGRYWGIYVLMEKIKRDGDRVDISRLDSSEVDGDALTGGYIIKVDKTAGENNEGWRSPHPPFANTNKKILYQYHYPKPDEIVPQQAAYIQAKIAGFEDLMASPGYADPDTGYSRLIDVDSFVDFFIINELSRNVDAYRLSAFMYKDRDSEDGRLFMGPVWDFNLAFGNANYYNASLISGWQLEYFRDAEEFHQADGFQMPFWWGRLWQDEDFLNKVYRRWWALRWDDLRTDRLLRTIDAMVDTLGPALERNFIKWPVLGTYVWPNWFIGMTYEEEIDYLKNWIQNRIEWMDGHLRLGPSPVDAAAPDPGSGLELHQNMPNPFNSQTIITCELRSPGQVKIEIYNLLGQHIRTLFDGERNAGLLRVRWDGRDRFGTIVPAGVYTCRLTARAALLTRKMLFLR